MADDLRRQLGKALNLPTNDSMLDRLLNLLNDWQAREVTVGEAKVQLEQDPKLRSMQSQISFEGAHVKDGLTIGDVAAGNIIKIFVNLTQSTVNHPKNYIPLSPNRLFQARPGEFKQLEELLFESSKEQLPPCIGLIGMGGIGKSQLAVEFAYRCLDQHRYPGGVFWMTATGKDVFDWQRHLAALAVDTDYLPPDDDLSSPDNERRRAHHLCRYLAEHQDALLVLDNVEDPNLVTTALPILAGGKVACTVLYTSRVTLLPEGGWIYPVKELLEESALRLLLQETRQALLVQIEAGQQDSETQSAREVCQSVGYLPLALTLLRGLLRRDRHLTMARLQQVLTQRGVLNLVQALSSTFALSWEQVQGEETQRLFKLACYFPEATTIPLWLLGLAAGLGENSDIFEPLGKACVQLQELSLLEELSGNQVRLHTLVRAFGRQLVDRDGDKGKTLLADAGERLIAEFTNLKKLEQRALSSNYWLCLDQVREACAYLKLFGTVDQGNRLERMERWLDLESYLLGDTHWWPSAIPGLFYQQLYNRSVVEEYPLEGERTPSRWIRQMGHVGSEDYFLLRIFAGHPSEVENVAFSPDGSKVLTGYFKMVNLWETYSGKLLAPLHQHMGWVTSIAFSPDGSQVLTGSDDRTACLWETSSGKLLRTLTGHTDYVTSVMFSSDGSQVLTGSADRTACLWETSSGKLLTTFRGHTGDVISVALSPDGSQVLTGSIDNTVKLWEASSGNLLQTLKGHFKTVMSIAFSPDGHKILTGSADWTARLWETNNGKILHRLDHREAVYCIAFSPDGSKVLTGSDDRTACLWETSSGRLLQTLKGHSDWVRCVAFTPDGSKLLTGSHDGTVRLWEARGGKLLQILRDHSDKVLNAVFSPDGSKVLTGSSDRTARLWQVTSSQELSAQPDNSNNVSSIVISPDGSKVLTVSGFRTVQLWDASSGEQVAALEAHSDSLLSINFALDGSKVLAVSFETVWMWEASNGKLLHTYYPLPGNMLSAIFSPDGSKMLTGSVDHMARLWDVNSGEQLTTFNGHSGDVRRLAFSPDGSLVLTGSSDSTAKLWEKSSGKLLQTLEGHSAWVSSVAFSPDGSQVLTGSDDGTARLWETKTGKYIEAFEGHSGKVLSAVFSPNGHFAMTFHEHGWLLFWRTSEPERGSLLGIHVTKYTVKTAVWQKATRMLLADAAGPQGQPRFYELILEGAW